jgi:hypothetical protein
VDDALLERPPAFEGRWLSMILAPNVQQAAKSAQPQKELKSAQA